MAILDYQLRMSNEQAVTVTAASTNIINTGGASSNIGRGNPLYVFAEVHTLFDGGTSIAAALQDSADGSTDWQNIIAGAVVTTANAIAGKDLLATAVPLTSRQYLRVNYTVVGTHTAGKVNAWIGLHPQV